MSTRPRGLAHQTVKRAAEKAGGVAALAKAIGVKPESIYSWTRIPAERAAEVERVTGIPRHNLRPDLWPEPAAAA